MKECILLSHVFIKAFEYQKIDKVNFALEHFRNNNPNSYIIVTGHGKKPNNLKTYCDYVYWPQKIIRSEINYGHPYLVNKGIDHAISKGFKYLLKTRLDSIHLIKDLFKYSLNNLKEKNYLTTQITTWNNPNLCDLFNFSKTLFMKKCWDINNWHCTNKSGLYYHAKNFQTACNQKNWNICITKNCVIKNIFNLKWIDLRSSSNWSIIKHHKSEIMENKLSQFTNYLWGTSEGWINWDEDGYLKSSNTWRKENLITEENMLSKENKIIDKI